MWQLRSGLPVLLTGLLVTIPLWAMVSWQTGIVNIDVRPLTLDGVRLLTTAASASRDGNRVVYFDLIAAIQDVNVATVGVFLRPGPTGDWVRSNEANVSAGLIVATVQLGSAQYPIGGRTDFSFKLVAEPDETGNGRTVTTGTIVATPESRASTDPWLVAAIGMLASVIQLLTLFWERRA